jgi:ASC-1-like (ASCH) protein
LSKILTICFKEGAIDQDIDRKIRILSKHIVPDNITPKPPKIIRNRWVVSVLINPCDSLPVNNSGICMGHMINPGVTWWKIGTDIPDGSFALIRCDDNEIELITDSVGSRTIWYIKTNDLFIASTSQRAIIIWLQEFVPTENVYAWVLSSGILGPGLSWDKRIRCLPSKSRLRFNKKKWDQNITKDKISFRKSELSMKAHHIELLDSLNNVFEHLNIDISKWILTLSGGRDSRTVLVLLLNHLSKPKCITWGTKSSLKKRQSDAYIANKLAEQFNLEFEYCEIEYFKDLNKTIDRVLRFGEGRIDNISAYIDGFKIWKQIYESGMYGIIRGDEAFGYRPIENSKDLKVVSAKMGLTKLTEYSNLKPLKSVLSEFKQEIPEFLNRNEDETVDEWRDRMDHEFQMPLKYAALNDLKLSYVEIITPLLSNSIMECVKRTPSELRTDKTLFKNIVQDLGPNIEFAKTESFPSIHEVVYIPELVDIMVEELRESRSKELLSKELIEFLVKNIKHKINKNARLYYLIKRNIKEKKIGKSIIKLKKTMRPKKHKGNTSLTIDINLLAFLAFIICKMNKLLKNDANILN